jgi:hypothetical protein
MTVLHGVQFFRRKMRSVFLEFSEKIHLQGLIMATGNVGQYLSYDIGDANTYFSRDAGWSWVEVAKGAKFQKLAIS